MSFCTFPFRSYEAERPIAKSPKVELYPLNTLIEAPVFVGQLHDQILWRGSSQAVKSGA